MATEREAKQGAGVFRRDTEREAYRYLHERGVDAFDDHYGPINSHLINDWDEAGFIRISYTDDGYVRVRTFKKYL